MANKYNNVIIFGATGDVGSVAALEANKRGAKVWLAMRDTSKTINGIGQDQEQKGSFSRIKADLSDPASVKAAIQESGAKAAYFYFIPAKDGLRGAIQAMKKANIEYVVFLSSSSIGLKNPRDVTMQENIIAFGHSQVEIALEDSGIPFTTIRPGFFASNSLRHNLDTSKTPWEAVLMRNSGRWDNISPLDIGRVSGAVLVNPPSTGSKEIISLFGPQLLTLGEMWDAIQNSASKEIRITYLPPDEYRDHVVKQGIPPPIADDLVRILRAVDGDTMYPSETYDSGVANIEKYSGYKPQSFADYLAAKAP